MRFTTVAAALSLLSVASTSPTSKDGGLPKVDLGYEIYRANSLNETTKLYRFNNIRYAAPPTGENRFRAPQLPAKNRTAIQDPRPNPICPQASPLWGLTTQQFIREYFMGQRSFNQSDFEQSPVPANFSISDIDLATFNSSIIPPAAPGTTEDCLFLDVVVPEHLFKKSKHGKGAPVLVWIYGGGYTAGSKAANFDPSGLLAASQNGNDDGVIYVALNYRLGAFGWLSGPTFQEDGASNAGLRDQRFALEWVQKHIEKFGGDPKRVTVMGESAGGGSIMSQITAYNGLKGPAPFSQAIPQSPGFVPVVSRNQQEQVFQSYLKLLNVSTIEEARKLNSSTLQMANAVTVGLAAYGGFTYGPVVDGDFLPVLPGEALLHGKFDKSVKVMVGHNADEGLLFTSPFTKSTMDIENQLSSILPSVRAFPDVLSYIVNTLYPPIFDGSQAQNYTNEIDRASALTAELSFTCNTFYLSTALLNQTYNYLFSVPPALHGLDVRYTFYNANATSSDPMSGVISPKVAVALQEYITNFAMKGQPNGPGVPHFDMYGPNATVQNLNVTSIQEMRDPAANERCRWWQKALYV